MERLSFDAQEKPVLLSVRHAARSMWLRHVLFLVTAAVWSHVTMLPAYGAAEATSCAASFEARQLDYWLGDWDVGSPGSAGSGHSRVYLSLDKCLVVESWSSNTTDHEGKNVLAYNREDKNWHGLFVDNRGRVHVFEGNVMPGSAEFDGPSRDANGKAVLNRLRVVRVTADRVEQIWEKSPDNGASWTTEFRMEYSRKKS